MRPTQPGWARRLLPEGDGTLTIVERPDEALAVLTYGEEQYRELWYVKRNGFSRVTVLDADEAASLAAALTPPSREAPDAD